MDGSFFQECLENFHLFIIFTFVKNTRLDFIKSLVGHGAPIYKLAAENGVLFSGSGDGMVASWDAETLESLPFSVKVGLPVYAILVHGDLILIGQGHGGIHVVDRSAEIGGSPADGYSSSDALTALEEVATETLPSDMSYDYINLSYQEKHSPGGAGIFVMALVFVFLILAAQYESWKLPFSVLLGTPFAVLGAFLGLFLARFGSDAYVNNIFAQIGLIMLIGLAAKNAILIVEFAKMEYEKGVPVMEAAMTAARLRFRPILMTAFAFILGVTPLLSATGAGSQARIVMGMAVFSGMLIATILGVLLVPALFVMIEGRGKKKEVLPIETKNEEEH